MRLSLSAATQYIHGVILIGSAESHVHHLRPITGHNEIGHHVWPPSVTCPHVTPTTLQSEGHSSFRTAWDAKESLSQQKKEY